MASTNKIRVLREWPARPCYRWYNTRSLTSGLVAIRDFLKKRARYLRPEAQNDKADGVNVTPITVVASIDPELLENLIDMCSAARTNLVLLFISAITVVG
jgi:hypothetical protein